MRNMTASAGKRVLIIVQNLPVPFDRRVWQEATELVRQGYHVSVICPQGKGYEKSYEVLEAVHIYRHPLPFEAKGALGYLREYGTAFFWECVLTIRVAREQGFDILHACNPPDIIFIIGAVAKYGFGKKFLFDHHDLCPELFDAKFPQKNSILTLLHLSLRVDELLTFRVADIVISTNESYRDIAITRGKVSKERVFVVRSGPNLERLVRQKPDEKYKNGRQFLVGYVGVMGQQEGIGYLLEAARILIHEQGHEDIHFTLVGEGPARADMERLAQEKGIAAYVTFTGRVADEVLLGVLNTADVCVNADEFNAMNDLSTMNKIMEYMALAKPIVQFELKEGRFSAGESSLYARQNDARDMAEKILYLLERPELRASMGQAGRERVEDVLAWPHEAPKLIAAYAAISALPSVHEKWRWYANRLAAMSLEEILFRFQEMFRKLQDKYRRKPSIEAVDRGHIQQIPQLRERIIGRQIPIALVQTWEKAYIEAKAGNPVVLGVRMPTVPDAEHWHTDPITGVQWPRIYSFDIEYRHGAEGLDAKYIWELGRLQYLQPIAVLAALRQDVEMAQFCLREIESWIDNNPPYQGIHWCSGIELALRAVSIIVVTTLVGEYLTSARRGKIWATLAEHAAWIERYPSRFSSANNHVVAEGLGLFVIGTICTALPAAARWKEKGWQILCEASQNQILQDGVGAEQATAYLSFVAEMLLLGHYMAQHTGVEIPVSYTQALARAGEYIRWSMDGAGNVPHIGDDDNACTIGAYQVGDNYTASVLAAIAVACNRPDIAPPIHLPSLRQFFWPAERPKETVLLGVRTFDQGGYTIGRHLLDGREWLWVLDHAPLGYLSIAAHGHADTLSVWLHVDGQPVFVDAGTYSYHAQREARSYFRSTRAHNTLLVEEVDSSVMSGAFNWSRKAVSARVASIWGEQGGWIEVRHDGYAGTLGIQHHRRVHYIPNGGLDIADWLTGEAASETYAVESGFLLHPALAAEIQQETIVILRDNAPWLVVEYNAALKASLKMADYSEYFGYKQPAQRIVFSGMLAPMQEVIIKVRPVEK